MSTTITSNSLSLTELTTFMLAHREVVALQVAGEQPASIQVTESFLAGGAALVRVAGANHFFAQSVPLNVEGAKHIMDRMAGVVAQITYADSLKLQAIA